MGELEDPDDIAAEAAEDAFLAQMDGDDAPDALSVALEDRVEAPVEPAPTEETTEAVSAEPDAGDYEKALTAFRFAGLDPEGLTKTQVTGMGLALRDRQLRTDASLAEKAARLKELESKLEATAAREHSSAEPTQEADLTGLDPVLAELSDEAGSALKAYIKQQAAANAQRDAILRQAQADANQAKLERLRDGVVDRFPDLQNDDKFESVIEKMSVLVEMANAGQYRFASPRELMLDAARIAGLEEHRPGAQLKDPSTARAIEEAKANGMPRLETRRADGQGKSIGHADPDDAAIDWLEEHPGDVQGARLAYEKAMSGG